jgi:hypothetical protein
MGKTSSSLHFTCVSVTGASVSLERRKKKSPVIISGFRRDVHEIGPLLAYYAAVSGSSLPTFRDTHRSHLQGSTCPRRKALGCAETSVRNCHSTLRNIAEHRRSQFRLPLSQPVEGAELEGVWQHRAENNAFTQKGKKCTQTVRMPMRLLCYRRLYVKLVDACTVPFGVTTDDSKQNIDKCAYFKYLSSHRFLHNKTHHGCNRVN